MLPMIENNTIKLILNEIIIKNCKIIEQMLTRFKDIKVGIPNEQ